MAETKPLTPSPFGPKGYVSPEESARIRSNRANAFAESILSAIRGGVKAVTTDLPGFVMDIADKIAGDTKTLGEKDRSEQMFSAVTGTQKKNEQAELVGSFVNPIALTQAMILPAFLTRNLKEVKEAANVLDSSTREVNGIFRLPENVDDGILRTVIDPRQARFKMTYEDLDRATRQGRTLTVQDVIDFPDLQKAAPNILSDVQVASSNSRANIYFDPSKNKIYMGHLGGSTQAFNEAFLHELQHGVQSAFKMNPGAAPEAFISNPARLEATARLAENVKNLAKTKNNPQIANYAEQATDYLKQLDNVAMNRYLRTAGESEARAVEKMFRVDPREGIKDPLSFYGEDLSRLILGPDSSQYVDNYKDMSELITRLIDIQANLKKSP